MYDSRLPVETQVPLPIRRAPLHLAPVDADFVVALVGRAEEHVFAGDADRAARLMREAARLVARRGATTTESST